MPEDNSFRFTLPKPPEGTPVTLEQAEQLLLARLAQQGGADVDTLWQLARLYSVAKRHDESFKYLRRILDGTSDVEQKAHSVLALGQLMEQKGDFEAAINYYSQAFSMEPCGSYTWYFIHNNLGFCLNRFGRYSEGEKHCRAAIKIDPGRPNGYKNMGIALEGQNRFAEAALAFISALRANAADPRALRHLEALVAAHPELAHEIPDIDVKLRECREAVGVVQKLSDEIRRRAEPPPEENPPRP